MNYHNWLSSDKAIAKRCSLLKISVKQSYDVNHPTHADIPDGRDDGSRRRTGVSPFGPQYWRSPATLTMCCMSDNMMFSGASLVSSISCCVTP